MQHGTDEARIYNQTAFIQQTQKLNPKWKTGEATALQQRRKDNNRQKKYLNTNKRITRHR